MIAVISCPAGKGQINFQTVDSIFGIFEWLTAAGYQPRFAVRSYAEVVEARNMIATGFVHSDAEIMIGIDDDVGVEREAFVQMLSAEVDYIGACIPQRQMELSTFAEGVRSGLSDRDAERHAAPLVDGPNVAEGISEVERVGCGFYILRREPLERMLELDMVPRKVLKVPGGDLPSYGYYDHIYDEIGNRLSEDYSFSSRMREAGYSVHAYKGPGITHTGAMTFRS